MRVLVLFALILVLAACATPAPALTPQPSTAAPVAPTIATNAPRPSETRAAETRAAESSPTNAPKPVPTNTIPPTPVATDPAAIPPSFFAMNTVNATDYPKLTFGTMAHPEIGAWAWIERSKGAYDFSLFDKYVGDAVAHGLVDSTNTVNLAITLGTTPPWAAADPRSCVTTKGVPRCTSGPANIQDWSNFVAAVMNHGCNSGTVQ